MAGANHPGYGAAAQVAAAKFGGPVNEIEAEHTVTTTETTLLNPDPERVALLVVNLGSNDVYLGYRPGTSAGKGIWLAPNGGSVTFDAETDGVLTARQVYAIAIGASSTVFTLEVRREGLSTPAGQ